MIKIFKLKVKFRKIQEQHVKILARSQLPAASLHTAGNLVRLQGSAELISSPRVCNRCQRTPPRWQSIGYQAHWLSITFPRSQRSPANTEQRTGRHRATISPSADASIGVRVHRAPTLSISPAKHRDEVHRSEEGRRQLHFYGFLPTNGRKLPIK